MKRRRPVTWIKAVHESSHAVVAELVGATVRRVTVVPLLLAAGCVELESPATDPELAAVINVAGDTGVELLEPGQQRKLDEFVRQTSPAGWAAIKRAFEGLGLTSEQVQEHVTSDGRAVVTNAAAVKLGGVPVGFPAAALAAVWVAVDILNANRAAVVQLAEELHSERTVSGDRVREVLAGCKRLEKSGVRFARSARHRASGGSESPPAF